MVCRVGPCCEKAKLMNQGHCPSGFCLVYTPNFLRLPSYPTCSKSRANPNSKLDPFPILSPKKTIWLADPVMFFVWELADFSLYFPFLQLFMIDNCADDWRIAMTWQRMSQIGLELAICAVHPIPGRYYFTWTTKLANSLPGTKPVTEVRLSLSLWISFLSMSQFWVIPIPRDELGDECRGKGKR